MKNILIIYPHWPPSNLAGVHRARLISNFLPEFGWHPIILTVKPEYYEEPHDWDMIKTVAPTTEVIHVDAKPVRKPRVIGDIGLRAFKFLKKEALKIISERKIDFVWIPIPSFYVAVLGRILHEKTGIPYGIDYIDPWVMDISKTRNMRAILSNMLAHILEPYAVKKASLISGVAYEYYRPMIERNFKNQLPLTVAMPYGFNPKDHEIIIDDLELPWSNIPNCTPLVYAGAFLPNAAYFTQKLFSFIRKMIDAGEWDKNTHLFFLGTGYYPYKSITEYAADEGISEYIHEIRERFPFLHILNFLSKAYGVLVIGSTEQHYTASKIFQSLLSKRPVFSVFHHKSTVCDILADAKADTYLVKYFPDGDEKEFDKEYIYVLKDFVKQNKLWQPDLSALDKYSAKESARILVEGIEKAIQ